MCNRVTESTQRKELYFSVLTMILQKQNFKNTIPFKIPQVQGIYTAKYKLLVKEIKNT
jgi:hypothetical protein